MRVSNVNLLSFKREFKTDSNLKQKGSLQMTTKNVATLENLPITLSSYGILLNRHQNVSFKGWGDDESQSPRSEGINQVINKNTRKNLTKIIKKYNVDVKKDVPVAITTATSAGYILAKGAETLLKAPTSEITNTDNKFIYCNANKNIERFMRISNNIKTINRPSFKKKAYTNNGNTYDKTNTGKAVGGTLLGGLYITCFTLNKNNITKIRDKIELMSKEKGAKHPKRIADIIMIIGVTTIGSLFGGIVDYINNKQRQKIADQNNIKS